MIPRTAHVERRTAETQIDLVLHIDGEGRAEVGTGLPFFDHMLTLFARHSLTNLTVTATGDLDVDSHHTVEDVGIALGQAFAQALGDKRGIARYGSVYVPMDETLARVVVDFSGRAVPRIPAARVGGTRRRVDERAGFFVAVSRGIFTRVQRARGGNPARRDIVRA